jgi:hypothetical protein
MVLYPEIPAAGLGLMGNVLLDCGGDLPDADTLSLCECVTGAD